MVQATYLLNFDANLEPVSVKLRDFSGDAQKLISSIQNVATAPLQVSAARLAATAPSGTLGAQRVARDPQLREQLRTFETNITESALAGGADLREAFGLKNQILHQVVDQLADQIGLVGSDAVTFRESLQSFGDSTQVSKQAALEQANAVRLSTLSEADKLAANRLAAEQTKLYAAQSGRLNRQFITTKARRIVAESELARQVQQSAIQEARARGIRGSQLRAIASEAGTPKSGGRDGIFPLFRQGLRNIPRILPSLIAFQAGREIIELVKEAERLQQINVRLTAQFDNLSRLGAFEGITDSFAALNDEVTSSAVARAELELFKLGLKEIAADTGVATDEVFALGSSFVGLIASIGDVGLDFRALAEQSTQIAAEFSVITGLAPEEAFNDLVGAVRTFADEAGDVPRLLRELSDDLVSVADVSGISADRLADFVGRIAPVADTAGFLSEEITAIGGALLQASGVGGAALAEQFGRIISTFGDGLDDELARLAVSVPDIGLDVNDIFAGNTRDVLLDLIKGFDSLTEAQQRQIVASLGSRREGNTLATLLQNNSAVLEGLRAQQDNAGASTERFGEIQQTLTVRLNQLQVQLEVVGQKLLESGLEDALIGIIDVVSEFAEVTARILGPFLKGLGVFFDNVSPKALAFAAALGIASRSVQNFIALQSASVATSAATGLQAAITGATVSTARFAGVAAAAKVGVGLLGPAAAVAAAGFTAYSLVTEIAGRNSRETERRVKGLTDALREAGNAYVLIGDRAREYNETLAETQRIEENRRQERGDFAGASQFGGAVSGAVLFNLADERDDLEQLRIAAEASGLSLTQFLEQAILVDQATGRLRKQEYLQALGSDDFDRLLGDDPTQERLQFVAGLQALIESEAITQGEGLDFFKTVIAASDSQQAIIEAQVKSVEAFLTARLDAENVSSEIRKQINDLLSTDPTDRDFEGQIDFLDVAAALFPKELGVVTGANERARREAEELREEINEGLVELAAVRAQFEAGLASAEEFREAAGAEVDLLRTQLDAAIGADNLEDAARLIGEINDIEKELAQIALDRFEVADRIAGLLGDETEGIDQLLAIALNIDIQNDPEAFFDAVVNLVEKEKELAFEAASRAATYEQAVEILDSFSLSDSAGQLAVETQLRNEGGILEPIFTIQGDTEDFINDTFDGLADDINRGVGLKDAIEARLLARLEGLRQLVGTLGPQQLEEQNRQNIQEILDDLAVLETVDLPNIFAESDFGLDGDEQAEILLQIAQDRFERNQEVAALLGQSVGGVDDLRKLAENPSIQQDQEAFFAAVSDLIETEKDLAIEIAERSGSAEAAIELLNNFELSVDTGNLFVEQQLRQSEDVLTPLISIEGDSEEYIAEVFEAIAAQVNAGVPLERAIREYLLGRIAELQVLLDSGPVSQQAAAANALALLDQAVAALQVTDLPSVSTGADIGINGEEIAGVADDLSDQYELVLESIEEDTKILAALGRDKDPIALGTRAGRLARLLQNPDFTNSELRLQTALELAATIRAINELSAGEIAISEQAVLALTEGIDPEQLVTTEAVFAAISNQGNAFNQFIAQYLSVGEDTLNGLLRAIAEFVIAGKDTAEALALATAAAIEDIKGQIGFLETSIFVAGFGGKDTSATRERLADLRAELLEFQKFQFRTSFGSVPIPEIDVGGVTAGNVGIAPPDGGGGSDSAKDAAADLAAAEFELLRAQFARDPIALARIAQQEAQAQYDNAKTEADRIRAQAAIIRADNAFEDAIKDSDDARRDLASAIAESNGNLAEVVRLSVEQAEEDLQFLLDAQGIKEATLSKFGFGEEVDLTRGRESDTAEISNARAALVRAQEQAADDLFQEQLSDLDFLYELGTVTRNEYISQLEGLLSTLDPVADKEAFQSLSLTIKRLKDETNDLQFNIPESIAPSLFEVRRLAQQGFGGTPDAAAAISGGNVDNRQFGDFIIYVNDGNLQEVTDAIREAIGDGGTFSTGTSFLRATG